jgi:hypothetical protein
VPTSPTEPRIQTSRAWIEHLADCIRDNTQPIASGRHARHVLELMLAGQQSACVRAAQIDVVPVFQPGRAGSTLQDRERWRSPEL